MDIYTDGACIGNPGPGGWGAVLRYGKYEKELYGSELGTTTNNRMELMAPIRALGRLTRPSVVRVYTDSTYVKDGITSWLPKWKANGWRTGWLLVAHGRRLRMTRVGDILPGMATPGRFGFWFPVALLGFLSLSSVLFTQGGWWADERDRYGDYQVATTLVGLGMSRAAEQQLHFVGQSALSPGLLYDSGWWPPVGYHDYWLFGVVIVFLAVTVWYGRRSCRPRTVVLAGLCGAVGIVALSWTAWLAGQAPDLARAIAGSLLAMGLCAAVWTYFRMGSGKSVLVPISVAALVVGACGLLAVWTDYRADELLAVGGLAVLAWWERSLSVAALAGVLLLVSALVTAPLAGLVVASGLLLVFAFVALVRRQAVAT